MRHETSCQTLFSLLVPCTMVKGYKKSPQTSLSTFCEICCYFHIFCVNILSKHTVSYILLFHLWQNSIRCFIFQKLIIESLCFNYSNLLILISRRFSGYSYFSECLNPYVRCFLVFISRLWNCIRCDWSIPCQIPKENYEQLEICWQDETPEPYWWWIL